jgi:monomeric sarcosine oxidase
MSKKVYRLAVIGAGVNGLCALHAAVRRDPGETILLEQHPFGHDRGSSHGYTRVTRSAYIDEDYVRLMQVAHGEAWPELERTLGRQLIHRCDGCFYGSSNSLYAKYADAVSRVGVDVIELTPAKAREKYPQFVFGETEGVLVDRTAGLIAARDTISGLTDHLRTRSHLRDQTAVLAIDAESDPIRITTNEDVVLAERVIVTAGPWVARLLPEASGGLRVARQTVGYIELEGDPLLSQLGRFPVWGHFGEEGSMSFYGLPEYGRPGIKVARHVIWNRSDDPDAIPKTPDPDAIEDLKAFVDAHFTLSIKRFVDTEFCHYTNTVTEDFILDHLPGNERLVVGAGFSGHGFKFGPVTGRILADLALDGHCELPEFVSARNRFRFKGGNDS